MLREKLFGKREIEDSGPTGAPSKVSKYFSPSPTPQGPNLPEQLIQIQSSLNTALKQVNFVRAPVAYVYNPTEYARAPFELYLRKFANFGQKILLVGMNPGPFGMCQTGVPFGDADWAKNWLKIDGPVQKPAPECPSRPVQGYACARKEQSGDRFWTLWRSLCPEPERFFLHSFVYNYCPLAFMDEKGRNLTPSELKEERQQLEAICDRFYGTVLELFDPAIVIAVGKYAEKRTRTVQKTRCKGAKLLCLPHPSPRTKNNQNWHQKALDFLETNNLLQFYQ